MEIFMKLVHYTLPIVTCLTLSACGGSGGGTSHIVAQTPQPTPTIATNVQGNLITLNNRGAREQSGLTNSTTHINKIAINGKTLDFLPSSCTAASCNTTINNVRIVGGSSALSKTRYGYIREGNGTPYLFAQGELSPNPPTDTKSDITYLGNAVQVSSIGGSTRIEEAAARFVVNFDKKTITGTIETPQTVNLSGTISGNRFSGTSTQGYHTTGYFYGDNAGELGGVYHHNTYAVSGAFGAKK